MNGAAPANQMLEKKFVWMSNVRLAPIAIRLRPMVDKPFGAGGGTEPLSNVLCSIFGTCGSSARNRGQSRLKSASNVSGDSCCFIQSSKNGLAVSQ